MAVEFDFEGVRDDGQEYSNTYVNLIQIKGGKVAEVREFAYDYGKFSKAWES